MLDADINCIADLDAWAKNWRRKIQAENGWARTWDSLAGVWDDAREYAHALSAPRLLGDFDQPLRLPKYIVEDHDSVTKSIASELGKRLEKLCENISSAKRGRKKGSRSKGTQREKIIKAFNSGITDTHQIALQANARPDYVSTVLKQLTPNRRPK